MTKHSEYKYEEEAANNNAMALKLIREAYPDLFVLYEYLTNLEITEDELLRFFAKIRLVKDWGWGHVQMTIKQGTIASIDTEIKDVIRAEKTVKTPEML